jgi:hypothetical protein
MNDTGDAAATDSACGALLQREKVHGIRLVARAIADPTHPRDLSHIDHLNDAVSSHVLPDGPVHEFLDTCNALTGGSQLRWAVGKIGARLVGEATPRPRHHASVAGS